MTIETQDEVVALQRIGAIVSLVLRQMLDAAEPGMTVHAVRAHDDHHQGRAYRGHAALTFTRAARDLREQREPLEQRQAGVRARAEPPFREWKRCFGPRKAKFSGPAQSCHPDRAISIRHPPQPAFTEAPPRSGPAFASTASRSGFCSPSMNITSAAMNRGAMIRPRASSTNAGLRPSK